MKNVLSTFTLPHLAITLMN